MTIIYSILGMNLFGCKFCTDTKGQPINFGQIDFVNDSNFIECERKNFDNLLWALVTVFQVLVRLLISAYQIVSPYFTTLACFHFAYLFSLLEAPKIKCRVVNLKIDSIVQGLLIAFFDFNFLEFLKKEIIIFRKY